MPKTLKLISIILFFLSLLPIVPSQAQTSDTIRIVTYYPSPYGTYRELRAKRMAIGDDYIKTGSGFGEYDWQEYPTDSVHNVGYNADLVVQGNVGIGTEKPGAMLHIVGSSQNTLAIDSPAYPEITHRVLGVIKSYNAIATTAGGYLTGSVANDWIFRNEGGASIKFGRGAATDVTIDNSGNVGIGTTSPHSPSPAPSTVPGNLDVNDIWVRNANGGTGAWASQSGGIKMAMGELNTGDTIPLPSGVTNAAKCVWMVSVKSLARSGGAPAMYSVGAYTDSNRLIHPACELDNNCSVYPAPRSVNYIIICNP